MFSSFHDHKDDLRKRLSYTTHKLEMVETEFDSTRQYLETELRRAQEELEKFTEKLRRCVCVRAFLRMHELWIPQLEQTHQSIFSRCNIQFKDPDSGTHGKH